MPRDRDERIRREEDKREEHNSQQPDTTQTTYVKNANASGMGSLGRSEENSIVENDTEERIY